LIINAERPTAHESRIKEISRPRNHATARQPHDGPVHSAVVLVLLHPPSNNLSPKEAINPDKPFLGYVLADASADCAESPRTMWVTVLVAEDYSHLVIPVPWAFAMRDVERTTKPIAVPRHQCCAVPPARRIEKRDKTKEEKNEEKFS
jgi:hypothetical protein